ncbi:MAG: hypothetical protein IPJ49_18325 [Candidatus Obscuribacter sp.]|nr:hypothetical protein [Candidatus Obscuribacter sp.]
MSEANPHPPQSEKGATLDDLADEIKGKEPVNADLFAGLMNMVQATNSGESVTMPAAPARHKYQPHSLLLLVPRYQSLALSWLMINTKKLVAVSARLTMLVVT